MSRYVAAYDTEAVYPWWDRPSRAAPSRASNQVVAHSESPEPDGFSYTAEHVAEFLNGVRAVAEAHLQRNAPASFFLVAKMIDLAGPELRAILDHPLFDIQSHTFTHPNLVAISANRAALQYELGDAKKLIEDTFGRPVNGLTAPGGYTDGFRGQPAVLEGVWEAGYRYVRAVGKGPKGTLPALLDQPFWYTQDGFPDLLETPSHAWHDNILTGQPATVHWPPLLPWPYPTAMPRDARGVYEAYAPGIDYCLQQGLLYYMPIFHPWSIYRIDRRAAHVGMLLDDAGGKMEIVSCAQLYNHILRNPELAGSGSFRPSAPC